MPTRKKYKVEEVIDILFALPSDEEKSDDDVEKDSDEENDNQADTNVGDPTFAEESDTSDSDSGSSTLYMLADASFSSETESESGSGGRSDDESAESVDGDDVWKKTAPTPTPIDIDFDAVQILPAKAFTTDESPAEFFAWFFDDEAIQLLVEQTNLYARQNRIKKWQDTDSAEMRAFLGMLVAMGLHQLPSLDLYWSTDPLFRVSVIANIMPVKRFKKLLQGLHLNDNAIAPKKGEPNFDKLYKVRPLLELLNKQFAACCVCSTSQSIDEAMVLFKGRSSLKQYMPMKPTKRGYKIWVRADSNTGYVYQFQVYTGRQESAEVEVGLGGRVVCDLTENIQRKNIHVTFDNFFSSFSLMEQLYSVGIYSTATVRTNRKDLPSIAKCKSNLQRGDFKWRTRENTSYTQWQDTKTVHVLSTAFSPSTATKVSRKHRDGTVADTNCPLTVMQYTRRMGGVDRFDQRRECYSVSRRSYRWWLRIFYFLLDAAVVNAHLLFNSINPGKQLNQLAFRNKVFRGLVSNYSSRERRTSYDVQFQPNRKHAASNKALSVPDEVRLQQVGVHMPEQMEKFRRCRLCSSKTNNKRSRIQCNICHVPLCVHPCFRKFHAK